MVEDDGRSDVGQLGLGEVGYRVYGLAVGGKNYLGLPMPIWDDLPDSIRDAWNCAASAIADHVGNRVPYQMVSGADLQVVIGVASAAVDDSAEIVGQVEP